MTRPLKLAVIGCGDIAETRHLPTIAQSPDAALVALCDADATRSMRLAEAYGVGRVYADHKSLLADGDVDAYIVATPPWVTPFITMDCLRAGKYVLCEKPMATDLETARKVIEVEARSAARVQIGFTYRHGPLMEALKRWIDAGRLGAPLIYRFGVFDEVWDPVGNPEHYERIMRTLEHGSPSMHDGAHQADHLHFLTGSEVAHVEAFGIKTRPEFPTTNYDLATVHFQSGDIAKLEVGWFLPRFPRGEFEVLGPLGLATYNRAERYVELRVGSVTETVTLEDDWAATCFREQLRKFVAAVRAQGACVPGSADGLKSLRLTTAIQDAIARNRR